MVPRRRRRGPRRQRHRRLTLPAPPARGNFSGYPSELPVLPSCNDGRTGNFRGIRSNARRRIGGSATGVRHRVSGPMCAVEWSTTVAAVVRRLRRWVRPLGRGYGGCHAGSVGTAVDTRAAWARRLPRGQRGHGGCHAGSVGTAVDTRAARLARVRRLAAGYGGHFTGYPSESRVLPSYPAGEPANPGVIRSNTRRRIGGSGAGVGRRVGGRGCAVAWGTAVAAVVRRLRRWVRPLGRAYGGLSRGQRGWRGRGGLRRGTAATSADIPPSRGFSPRIPRENPQVQGLSAQMPAGGSRGQRRA